MSRIAQRMEMEKTLEGLPPPSDRQGRVRYVWNRIVAEATLVNVSQETADEEFFGSTPVNNDNSHALTHHFHSSSQPLRSDPGRSSGGGSGGSLTPSTPGSARAPPPPNTGNVGRRQSVAVFRAMSYYILSSHSLLDCVAKRIASFVAPKHGSVPSKSARGCLQDISFGDIDHDELIDYFRYYNNWRMDPEIDAIERRSPLQQLSAATRIELAEGGGGQQQQQQQQEGDSPLASEECFLRQRERFTASLDMTIEECIAEDILASYDRDPAALRFLEPVLYAKGFHALQLHRLAERLWYSQEIDFSFMLQSASSRVFGVDIHPAARFGYGVMMDHASGIVVGETSVVGNFVSMLHSVTLGGTGKAGRDRHPKIEDGVKIGASSSILGNIVIGERAKVAAGATVVKSVAPHTTVIGVAAKELIAKTLPTQQDKAQAMQELVPQSPALVHNRCSHEMTSSYRGNNHQHRLSKEGSSLSSSSAFTDRNPISSSSSSSCGGGRGPAVTSSGGALSAARPPSLVAPAAAATAAAAKQTNGTDDESKSPPASPNTSTPKSVSNNNNNWTQATVDVSLAAESSSFVFTI